MSALINKIRQVVEESLDTARHNAQNLKEVAGEYSRSTRIKFELHQLRSSLKKKIYLLGETVLPYLTENNYKDLKKHETLPVLIDSIKNLKNEIILAEKSLEEISQKNEEGGESSSQEIKKKIDSLEQEIESHLDELQDVKKSREQTKN